MPDRFARDSHFKMFSLLGQRAGDPRALRAPRLGVWPHPEQLDVEQQGLVDGAVIDQHEPERVLTGKRERLGAHLPPALVLRVAQGTGRHNDAADAALLHVIKRILERLDHSLLAKDEPVEPGVVGLEGPSLGEVLRLNDATEIPNRVTVPVNNNTVSLRRSCPRADAQIFVLQSRICENVIGVDSLWFAISFSLQSWHVDATG
mmetsp:Transcript_30997/g.67715  ORF Transcript_30997/g.67715 Transcript_30997/m.67715 type:complete len:204 (+) Transcript_30997:1187-1798(+)